MPKSPRRTTRRVKTEGLLTARELAGRRGVDPRTVSRWARAGCPVARPGKKGHVPALYDPAAVDAWLARGQDEQEAMLRAVIDHTDARARRTRGDLVRLANQYMTRAAVASQWHALAGYIRSTATALLVDDLATSLCKLVMTPPPPPPAPPRRLLSAEDVRRLLASGGPLPWRPAATPQIERFAERGIGIELTPGGGWHELSPEWEIAARPRPPVPPVVDALARAAHGCLSAIAAPPRDLAPASDPVTPPPPEVTSSKTLRAARAQLATLQRALVDLREAIAAGSVLIGRDVLLAGQTRVGACAGQLRRLPRLAGEVKLAAAAGGAKAVRAVLQRAVAEALRELDDFPHRGEHR